MVAQIIYIVHYPAGKPDNEYRLVGRIAERVIRAIEDQIGRTLEPGKCEGYFSTLGLTIKAIQRAC